MSVLHLTSESFNQKVIDTDRVVLVDFWATWCNPCRMLAPTIEQLSDEYGQRIDVCKLDVDQNDSVAADYGINSIPTVIVFKGGAENTRIVGMRSIEEYRRIIDEAIK